MKIIFKIARTELRNLFYSPVAWFLAVVFLIQCAYFYMAALYPLALAQDSMKLNSPDFMDMGSSLTTAVFFSSDGIMNSVAQNLYLFIPLLTMGMLSREVNSGTIKLLYSSPIKVRHIVLGKYLAVIIYNLVLLGILSFFIILGVFHVKSVDMGWLLSALFGFYLLVCAYSAIGMFMSSLSTYQIVSGIGSFVVIFILGRIGSLWQRYDFIRDLTWFLSSAGRVEKMLLGLITTRDVIYFLVLIALFLSFTLFKLKGEKESKPWTIKAARYFGVTLLGILLGYITSRPSLIGYWDTTAAKFNTINPKTQKILKEMGKEPLEITLYVNLFGDGLKEGLPESRNAGYLSVLWDKYQRFKPDIRFKYVYYYDDDGRVNDKMLYKIYPKKTEKQISGIVAGQMELDSSMFMPPQEIRKQIDPYKENLRTFMIARYKDKAVCLRTYQDPAFWPNETEIASKLKRMVEGNIPKVYYLTGNLERSIYKTGEREYSGYALEKFNRGSLINLGFDVDTLSLEKQDIPSDVTALVLADPKTELGNATRNKLRQFIDKGGNIMILGEPGKQAILNPVLSQIGVQLRNGQLVEITKDETPDKIYPYLTKAAFKISPDNEAYKRALKLPDTGFRSQTLMAGATALSYRTNGPFTISPILKTFRKNVWLKMGRLVTDSVPPVFSPKNGDSQDDSSLVKPAFQFSIGGSNLTIGYQAGGPVRGPKNSDMKAPSFTTAVSLTREVSNRQQRIIVFGDADYMSNMRSGNNVFGNNFFGWFDHWNYPVYIPLPVFKDNLLIVTAPAVRVLRTLCVWVLPGAVLLAGIILLTRRKRK